MLLLISWRDLEWPYQAVNFGLFNFVAESRSFLIGKVYQCVGCTPLSPLMAHKVLSRSYQNLSLSAKQKGPYNLLCIWPLFSCFFWGRTDSGSCQALAKLQCCSLIFEGNDEGRHCPQLTSLLWIGQSTFQRGCRLHPLPCTFPQTLPPALSQHLLCSLDLVLRLLFCDESCINWSCSCYCHSWPAWVN